MKILAIRMLGLGDVVSVGVAAARLLRAKHPSAEISFLTFGAGVEVMSLVTEVDAVIRIEKKDWPSELLPAIRSFTHLAHEISEMGFDAIYNFDTWFMPCLLARAVADTGGQVIGNQLRWSVNEVLEMTTSGALLQKHASVPAEYMMSSFPHMADWNTRWWDTNAEAGPYPRFYLEHCCGFDGPLNQRLSVPADPVHRNAAKAEGKRTVVAIALERRASSVRYPHGDVLTKKLQDAGAYVWSRFDGTQPIHETLGQLAGSDLLIAVGSAPQWLAQAAGCPTLLIPGHLSPATLQSEATIPKFLDCQFCQGSTCVEDIDYACYDVPVDEVVSLALSLLEREPRADSVSP